MLIDKIQKKMAGIKHAIDILEYEEDILTVKGWLFSTKHSIKDLEVLIEGKGKDYPIKITSGIRRNDVYRELHHNNSMKSGFYGKILIEKMASFQVFLCYEISERKYKIRLGGFESGKKPEDTAVPKVTKINTDDYGIDILPMIKQRKNTRCLFPEKLYQETVDIVIPIYNGYQYLEKLLETVPLTKMNYRLILVDDCSPDERIWPFLEEFARNKSEVILLKNEENLGFVKSVNRALELTRGHVALVNSDVELPENWLERLMMPIILKEKVASSTPYSNCGVITSFPDIGENNELFEGLSLREIDSEFQKILPRYVAMPTGVGFCMGMNRETIREIGVFDAKNFGMGYGEENDWCQRAIQAGYRNVQVENLFVYHKHGGSFQSEDKKRFIENNSKVLAKKHPAYESQVAKFFTIDPNKDIRKFVTWNLIHRFKNPETIIAFNHSLGGGAGSYLVEKRRKGLEKNIAFCEISFNPEFCIYEMTFYYDDYKIKGYVRTRKELFGILGPLKVVKIWINELVTYPHIYKMLEGIAEFAEKKQIGIRMLLHDFFAVCPSVTLMQFDEYYCDIPECEECQKCFAQLNSDKDMREYISIEHWRKEWKQFLQACEEIVVFSNNSRSILEKAYGKIDNIKVVPHQIPYIPVLEKKYKTTHTINIGLLGILTKHKGEKVVRELVREIEKKKLNIRLILIGSCPQKIDSPVFKETGRYSRGALPRLVLQNDIDVFLISSVCPETFSYTTDEIIHMGMPVMCFDVGAPVERVSAYERGIVLPDISIQTILKTIETNTVIQEYANKPNRNKRVLFVVEEVTFSSRYRVSHLREQLLCQGIASDIVLLSNAGKISMHPYENIVIYRSSAYKQTEEVVKKAHKLGKKVYYDTDDYIYDYEAIHNLGFLSGKGYENFQEYSKNIQKSMELCDAYIVSTENLRNVIEKDFPEKSVIVNRNVASMEMLTISKGVEKQRNKNKIVLGYFSGSKTHDADFHKIKDIILDLMDKNEKVHLLIGGQIELPPEFNMVYERIERFDFIDWRKLPALIAKADINLMPLEDTFFHACKSENKWMEAALVQVPTIASWNSELELAIADGVDGELCRNEDEWRGKLQRLVDDETFRQQLAKAAHEKVLERYTTFSVEQDVVDALIHC